MNRRSLLKALIAVPVLGPKILASRMNTGPSVYQTADEAVAPSAVKKITGLVIQANEGNSQDVHIGWGSKDHFGSGYRHHPVQLAPGECYTILGWYPLDPKQLQIETETPFDGVKYTFSC